MMETSLTPCRREELYKKPIVEPIEFTSFSELRNPAALTTSIKEQQHLVDEARQAMRFARTRSLSVQNNKIQVEPISLPIIALISDMPFRLFGLTLSFL
jgi:hypothetical protein